MKKLILITLFLLVAAAARYLQELYLFREARFAAAYQGAKSNLRSGRWPLLPWNRKSLKEELAGIRQEIQEGKRSG